MKQKILFLRILLLVPQTAIAYITFFVLLNFFVRFSTTIKTLWYIPFIMVTVFVLYSNYKEITQKPEPVQEKL